MSGAHPSSARAGSSWAHSYSLTNAVTQGADGDTQSAPGGGDPCFWCSLWKSVLAWSTLGCLIIAALSPTHDTCNSLLLLGSRFPNLQRGGFESKPLSGPELLNSFLFCWKHFLVAKDIQTHRFPSKPSDVCFALFLILSPSFSYFMLICMTVFIFCV